jgi:hypothetical protein
MSLHNNAPVGMHSHPNQEDLLTSDPGQPRPHDEPTVCQTREPKARSHLLWQRLKDADGVNHSDDVGERSSGSMESKSNHNRNSSDGEDESSSNDSSSDERKSSSDEDMSSAHDLPKDKVRHPSSISTFLLTRVHRCKAL